MSNFFDLKARKAAAATSGSSSTKQEKKADAQNQPWVEK
jgi:replication factor C subunit 2/4